MDDLKAWLNSDRIYTIGTQLYAKYGVKEFRKGGIFYKTINKTLKNL
jgi:hypothetical protein